MFSITDPLNLIYNVVVARQQPDDQMAETNPCLALRPEAESRVCRIRP